MTEVLNRDYDLVPGGPMACRDCVHFDLHRNERDWWWGCNAASHHRYLMSFPFADINCRKFVRGEDVLNEVIVIVERDNETKVFNDSVDDSILMLLKKFMNSDSNDQVVTDLDRIEMKTYLDSIRDKQLAYDYVYDMIDVKKFTIIKFAI